MSTGAVVKATGHVDLGLVKTITSKADFLKVRASGNNQVFIFTAKWCPACMSMKPTVERMARLFVGKIQFFTLDYDNPALGELFDIHVINGIPTFLLSDECSQTFLSHEGTFEDKKFEQALRRLIEQSCQKNTSKNRQINRNKTM